MIEVCGGGNMMKNLHNFRKGKKGFTLIELLIVVAIIAILAAIAIPQFSAYRKRGYNADANSDLRHLRTTEEAVYADFTDYGATNATSQTGTSITSGVQVGPGVTIFICGGRTTTVSQSTSLSPGVYAMTNVTFNGTFNTAYAAVTAHGTGEVFYGVDSDVTTLYRKGYTAPFVVSTYDITSVIPTSTYGASDFASPTWTAVQ